MSENLVRFEDYLLKEKKYSLHTAKAYVKDLWLFFDYLVEVEGGGLEEVSYSLVRGWIISLVESGVSNLTVNRKMASLKAFYKFLLKIKVIDVSPMLQHKYLKAEKKIQVPFSEKELELALNQIEYNQDFEGLRDKLIIDLFYTTGIRRSELINLQLVDVDFDLKVLKVLGKRNKERIIPVLDVIFLEIKQYLEKRKALPHVFDEEYLFLLGNGKKMNETFVYRLINCYLSVVSEKVKKSPHMLRHTFATHMLNRGADLNSIKEFLGHSSLASTQVYTQSSLGQIKEVYKNAHPRGRK
ncbi:integrase [Flavobacterium columnare]|uniref:Integrase/recombinase XerC n=1 Tax=Flavobacterium columnare (strain ATCC 49512 / CIP 103533 / TG 44/87) TaxID=1041826 RepID=G8X5Q3_FLACA|nr:tyrosine-type recombinase/integrase [Flavobacterium columnare]AEW86897.1 integrase/recombinase XerC [Flavobacterium columnare ATCC 49512]ANO47790.1 integrase/recombinase XerC [Flavobacterium columnare]APT21605.1 integrase [Flavobacterium columnare]MBF6652215.1 integrase [Flavobacterium columnare]MEB3799631.1 tyrosine-type recombinase/integrase [Flavobacterium columnare]